MYKQIKPRKIYEEVAETLFQLIKNGELKPGDKLDSVQQLAENFQVGRSAIREALSALRALGLIEMKQGEGTFVREFDPEIVEAPLSVAVLMKKEDILHLLEVRRILETGGASSAVLNRNEKDLLAMESALNDMKSGFGQDDLDEKADIDFHLAVAAATHNPILISLMNNVSGMMAETIKETRRLWLFSKQTTFEELYQEHVQIYKAIKDQNKDLAIKIMNEHLTKVESVLQKYMK